MVNELAVTEQATDLRDFLQKDEIKRQLAVALPKWLSADRLLRIVFTSVMKNPRLLDCTRESILSSIMQCAQLGLEPILGRAYLIPYENSKNIGGRWTKVLECQMQPGYQGLVDIARRSGIVRDVYAEVVFENDIFDVRMGTDREIIHKPNLGVDDQGAIIGAYTVWELQDGIKTFKFMKANEIYKRRDMSQAYKYALANPNNKTAQSTPWIQWPDEMMRKTVVKNHAKLQPASIEFMQAIEIDDRGEMGYSTAKMFSDTIDVSQLEGKPKQIEDIDGIFFQAMGKVADDPQFKIFVELTAKNNNSTIDAVKLDMAKNADAVKKTFDVWKSKREEGEKAKEKKPGPPAQKETQLKPETGTGKPAGGKDDNPTAFINEWLRLHGPAFKIYVDDNLPRFQNYPPWVKTKAQDKYTAKVGEPWPGTEIKTTVYYDPGENDDATNDLDGKATTQNETEGNHTNQTEIGPNSANKSEDITQLDEFQELQALQSKYPDIYRRIMTGRKLTSRQNLMEAIAAIDDAAEFESGGTAQ